MQSTLPALSSADFPWARGIENQRRAARGDGTFVNPIIPGDHPDPTVLADGGAYYATFSSFDAYPGLVLWRSTDLVNWSPLAPTLHENVGSVWAPELVKHDGRYFIYFHARTEQRRSIYVIYAKGIAGPWSEPIDLNIPRIDPGHAVGEDGKRYLFLSGGDRVRLSDDGLSTAGPIEHVYDYMAAADLLVTKPGGLTSAEALASGLPMVIVHPLPGQEMRNSKYLLTKRVAVRAASEDTLPRTIVEMLDDVDTLRNMQMESRGLATPDSASRTASVIMELLQRTATV